MTTIAVKSAVSKLGKNTEAEPVMLQKRIGSTMFIVNARFSNTATETMQDKVLRLIESEVQKSARLSISFMCRKCS